PVFNDSATSQLRSRCPYIVCGKRRDGEQSSGWCGDPSPLQTVEMHRKGGGCCARDPANRPDVGRRHNSDVDELTSNDTRQGHDAPLGAVKMFDKWSSIVQAVDRGAHRNNVAG